VTKKLPINKTTEDLLNDVNYTWDYPDTLEDALFDSDTLLESTFNNRFGQIVKGDIIMANNGVSSRNSGIDILTPHRVYIIEDAVGKPGSRTFRGYLISSKVEKANYYNKKFPNNIYIQNYDTILEKGKRFFSENLINLADLYTIEESKISVDSTIWKGHAKDEFIDFIDEVALKIKNGEDTSNIYWQPLN